MRTINFYLYVYKVNELYSLFRYYSLWNWERVNTIHWLYCYYSLWNYYIELYMSIYFNIIGIRKYVIKKIIYNIGNTIPWACYQQWL